MKRIFCDCCGEEFTYKDDGVVSTNNSNQDSIREVVISGKVARITLAVRLNVEPVRAINGSHIDICGLCRWQVIDQLDPRPVTASKV